MIFVLLFPIVSQVRNRGAWRPRIDGFVPSVARKVARFLINNSYSLTKGNLALASNSEPLPTPFRMQRQSSAIPPGSGVSAKTLSSLSSFGTAHSRHSGLQENCKEQDLVSRTCLDILYLSLLRPWWKLSHEAKILSNEKAAARMRTQFAGNLYSSSLLRWNGTASSRSGLNA